MQQDSSNGQQRNRYWLIALLIPCIVVLWPASYSRVMPELAGIPFFYWWQFLWVFITAAVTVVVYRIVG